MFSRMDAGDLFVGLDMHYARVKKSISGLC
jgi:hypothetical protein